jgi:hypothetical protein
VASPGARCVSPYPWGASWSSVKCLVSGV